MQISSNEQVFELRKCILRNAEVSKEKLMKCMETMNAVQFFSTIKFEKQGVDPIAGTELNLIEQIHQMYSDLVVLFAVQELLGNYPGKVFELHLGPEAGYDIQSLDGQIVAAHHRAHHAGEGLLVGLAVEEAHGVVRGLRVQVVGDRKSVV